MRRSKVNMREIKILLDTSFLLPIIEIRVREVESILEKLWIKYRRREIDIYYTELNLLEIAGN